MTDSLKILGRALLVPFLCATFALTAHAEEATKPVAKPAETVKPVTPSKPDATATPATTEMKVKKTKKPKAERKHKGEKHKGKKHKSHSVCSGLDETTCGANKSCAWIVPKHHKKHKLAKSYCRLVAGVALKHAKPMSTAPAKTN